MRLTRLVLGLPFVSLFACSDAGEKKAGAPPAPQVDVETVKRTDVPLFVESVASVDGYVNADIRARVRGYLRSQSYSDGAAVKEGELLFTIEATEFQSSVSSAKAALSRAKAAKQLADLDIERVRKLREMNAVPQQQLDEAEAQAGDTEGQVNSAQAALEQAQLSLSYTQIKSPVTGVAGLALVRVGNLVGQDGPTLLTTVSQVEPMRVRFPISELDYLKQPEAMKELAGRDLKWAQQQFARPDYDQDPKGIQLVLSDGNIYPHRGVLLAVDRNIDTSTGTIQVEALFPNPDRLLKPGQFARVRIRRTDAGENALVVSQKALAEVQGSYTIAVVGQDNKVSIRRIEVGPAAFDKRIVYKGVEEGEKVVVSGLQRVKDGVTVQPKDAEAAPVAQPAAGGTARAEAQPAAEPTRAEARPAAEPTRAEARPAAESTRAEARPAAESTRAEARPAAEPARAEARPAAEPTARAEDQSAAKSAAKEEGQTGAHPTARADGQPTTGGGSGQTGAAAPATATQR